MRDIEGPYGYSVVSRHIEGQRAPPTSGVDYRFSGAQIKFSTDVVHLCVLRFFQSGGGRLEVSTRIYQFAIEPELVEVVSQIVMAMDVFARAAEAIDLQAVHPLRHYPPIPTAGACLRHRAVH